MRPVPAALASASASIALESTSAAPCDGHRGDAGRDGHPVLVTPVGDRADDAACGRRAGLDRRAGQDERELVRARAHERVAVAALAADHRGERREQAVAVGAAVLAVVLAEAVDVEHDDRVQRAALAQHVEQRDQAVAAAGAGERIDLVQLRRLLAEQRALHRQPGDARDHARGLRLPRRWARVAQPSQVATSTPTRSVPRPAAGPASRPRSRSRRSRRAPARRWAICVTKRASWVRITAPATCSSASSSGPRSAVPSGISSSGAALSSVQRVAPSRSATPSTTASASSSMVLARAAASAVTSSVRREGGAAAASGAGRERRNRIRGGIGTSRADR